MSKKGFTLVELMVVIVIMGILAAVASSGYRESITKARVNELTTMEKTLREEIIKYAFQGGSLDGINDFIQDNYGNKFGPDQNITDVVWNNDTSLVITFQKMGKVPGGTLTAKAVDNNGGLDWEYTKSIGADYDDYFPLHLKE